MKKIYFSYNVIKRLKAFTTFIIFFFLFTNANAQLSANLDSKTDVQCNGGSDGLINLTISGGILPYTFTWLKNGNPYPSTTEDLSGLSSGTYSLTVTDALLTTSYLSITIDEPIELQISNVMVTNLTCNGVPTGALNLSLIGGTLPYNYIWSNGATTEDINGLTAGVYQVTITDAHLCTTTTNRTITEPAPLTVSITSQTNVNCYGQNSGNINLTSTGGTQPITYLWSNGATTEDLSGLTAGTYTSTVTDGNLCSKTVTAIITQALSAIELSATKTDVECNGGSDASINLTASGGNPPFTFSWIKNGTFYPVSDEDLSGLSSATYTVTVTDADLCSASLSVIINEPLELQISNVMVTHLTCFEDFTGALDLSLIGGTLPYTYIWSTGATTEDISGLAIGTYHVTITDAHNCITTTSRNITQPSLLTLSLVTTNVSNLSGNNGSINATVSGGMLPYTFVWLKNGNLYPAITEDLSGLSSGTYSLTVIDNHNCSQTSSGTISQNFIDLSVSKQLTDPNPLFNDSIFKNDTVTFTITLKNNSSLFNASYITIMDTLSVNFSYISSSANNGIYNPATGLWTLLYLNALDSAILNLKVRVDTSGENNVYIVGYDQPDSNLMNNHAFASVSVCGSSSGNDGGLESNGNLASKVGLRNFIRHKDRSFLYNDPSKLELFSPATVVSAKTKSTQATEMANFIPQTGPAGSPAMVTTPTDLIGISNAIEVISVDYFDAIKRKAAILAIASNVGTVYEHTKMVCDRLDGGSLKSINHVFIKGHPFILAGIVQDNGNTDYTVSFIAYKSGNTYAIDNQWDLEQYSPSGNQPVLNFQVWAANELQTIDLVGKIIDKMTNEGYNISYKNTSYPEFPAVYVQNGTYKDGNLELNLVNTSGANALQMNGTKALVEDGVRFPFSYSSPISTAHNNFITVPSGNIFDIGISLGNNSSTAKDILYFADGPWGREYDQDGASISDFSISSQFNPPVSGAFNMGRNANLEGSVKTYASLYRVLRVGNKSVNLSDYNKLEFTAFGSGSYDVIISKAGISNWNDQYRTTVNLDNNNAITYKIPVSQFANAQGQHNLNLNDAVSVVFVKKGNNSTYQNFTLNVKDMRFINNTSGIDAQNTKVSSISVSPNPFHTTTNITFNLPSDQKVKIELYGLDGKLIKSIENKMYYRGLNSETINAEELKAGVYMIKLETETNSLYEKVVLVK